MATLLPVGEFDLVIFGGNGDLALRKLIPALYHRDCDDQFTSGSRIIAVARSPLGNDEYRTLVTEALKEEKTEDATVKRFLDRLHYVDLDALDPASWTPLKTLLDGNAQRTRAVYLATPPALFGPVAQGFKANDLITEDMRIVLEKPVGHDFESACEINDTVGQCFKENQIFRIDHYLGKETVQNLIALRFGNSLFEPIWRREAIDHVQITVAEEIGVGNRIEFYNGIGALRDMVQNHLIQLLCLVAMEPPSNLDDDAVRDEKIKVLRSLRPIDATNCQGSTVRAQYSSGASQGQVVAGYSEELGSPSMTESFVAMKVEVDNWRWSGVPFYLRTGKRLPAKHSEILIQFKKVPHTIFSGPTSATPNQLSIMLQPNEGVKLTIMAKEAGPGPFALRPVSLDLSFEDTFGATYNNAYERLVIEALRGNPALFMRRDEIETAWRWIDGIIDAWEVTGQKLERYVAGTWGPKGSSLLLDRDQRAWNID
jgi:glucose-6-phosphate 1-dehydrogenase